MFKKVALSLMILSLSTPVFAYDQYVNGYTRSDGTYVQSYHRSSADSTQLNNYSTRGNTNPYSGQTGTVNVMTPSHNYGSNYGSGYSHRNNRW